MTTALWVCPDSIYPLGFVLQEGGVGSHHEHHSPLVKAVQQTQPSKGHPEPGYRKGWREVWAMLPRVWQWCRVKMSGGSHQAFLPLQVAVMRWEEGFDDRALERC